MTRLLVLLAALFCLSAVSFGSPQRGLPGVQGTRDTSLGGAESAPSMVQGGSQMNSAGGPVLSPTLARALAAQGEDPDPTPISGTDGKLSSAVEIALLLTVLSLLPAVLITLTSFTRIVIVLSFVRRALSLNELPPNPVLIGLALFLTMFVMAPVGKALYGEAWTPYEKGEIPMEEATGRAWGTLATFLVANTREGEMRLFAELSGEDEIFEFIHPEAEASVLAAEGNGGDAASREFEIAQGVTARDLPLTVVVPAFILSELKTAFQMGFLLFLPFLVIDLVVASVLLSMGMFMLPPAMISTPIKVLIFVLVDGWRLVTESVVTSFVLGGA